MLVFCLAWAGAGAAVDASRARVPQRSVRLALVQQDDDPRKDDYRAVFDTLRRLTDSALAEHPDMVVWSETAFVPNIRRWSREDPRVFPLAALVRDFLAYQESIHTWLLTGNDDYSFVNNNGTQERLDYNGSVLFSPEGRRVETYHKIHLVPFTEYFPYKKQLPEIYSLLMSFDAYLWEPGDRRVVFHHPKFSWSTPICFEDVFPNDVRKFVSAGAEVILNLSNDYWSLTETEGMQHAANAVFRAVENGRPLARAAASGLTCLVDSRGVIRARAPFYQESFLVVDVPLSSLRATVYTRWGDWFPVTLGVGLPGPGRRHPTANAAVKRRLGTLYLQMLDAYGPRGWWPVPGKRRPPRVRRARVPPRQLRSSRARPRGGSRSSWARSSRRIPRGRMRTAPSPACCDAGVTLPADILAMPRRRLAGLIRSSGYFNQKAKKLALISALFSRPRALTPPGAPPREALLAVWGIGRETADSILLYAFQKPVFVVDAYTRRILSRVGLIDGSESYDAMQALFHDALEPDPAVFNEYHALIVEHAKAHCMTRPVCAACPVRPCRHRLAQS